MRQIHIGLRMNQFKIRLNCYVNNLYQGELNGVDAQGF